MCSTRIHMYRQIKGRLKIYPMIGSCISIYLGIELTTVSLHTTLTHESMERANDKLDTLILVYTTIFKSARALHRTNTSWNWTLSYRWAELF